MPTSSLCGSVTVQSGRSTMPRNLCELRTARSSRPSTRDRIASASDDGQILPGGVAAAPGPLGDPWHDQTNIDLISVRAWVACTRDTLATSLVSQDQRRLRSRKLRVGTYAASLISPCWISISYALPPR
eukprot:1634614-Rhodomonas_salina.1